MIKCPLCKQSKVKEFFKKRDFFYFECVKCFCLFVYPLPDKKVLKQYYQFEFSYNHSLDNHARRLKQYEKVLKKMKKMNPQGKNLLDVGCGTGTFLGLAKHKKLKTLGIEPSLKLYKIAKERGAKVLNCTFEEFCRLRSNLKLSFDFITLFHVIEHISDPRGWIENLLELLRKGGFLYIETPNIDSYLYFSQREFYTFLTPPDHLILFSKRSFLRLLKNYKVKVNFSTYSYPEHLMGVVKSFIKGKAYVLENSCFNQDNISRSLPIHKRFKYIVFDRFLAPIFTPLMNIFDKGSILQIYIKKL